MLNGAFVVAAAEPDTNRILNGENIDAVRHETASSPKLTLNLGTDRLIGPSVPKEIVDRSARVYQ